MDIYPSGAMYTLVELYMPQSADHLSVWASTKSTLDGGAPNQQPANSKIDFLSRRGALPVLFWYIYMDVYIYPYILLYIYIYILLARPGLAILD